MSGDHSITITRTYNATPHELFEAWTDEGQYGAWAAAPPWSLGACQIDARPGGEYRIETIAPDDSVFTFFGHYTEIIPNERVANRGGMTGPSGNLVMDDADLVVTFSEIEPGVTEQTLVNSRLASAEAAEMFKQGWESSGLIDLERFLAAKNANA